MKRRTLTCVALLGLLLAAGAGELLAAGRGPGGPMGGPRRANPDCTQPRGGAGTPMANRPADAQRRDGSFLSTGTTANGSTERPGRGQGLQDGSRLTPAPAPQTAP